MNQPSDTELRILLVDDNPDDRLLVARTLRREFPGVTVEQVRFAEELQATLEGPPFDVVVTDYQLHWITGLEVLQRVRDAWPEVPVIMFTATGNEEIAVQAMKAGLDDYVLKSAKHFGRLSAAVRGALERARHRQQALHAERRYRQAIENSPNPIFTVGPDHRIQTWNPACERVFGYPAAEAIGQPWVLLVSRLKVRVEIGQALEAVFRGETQEALELRFRTRAGEERITLSRLFPVFAPDGTVEACVFANTDLTGQMRALADLEDAHRRLELMRAIDRAVLAGQPMEAVARLALERLQALVPYEYASVVTLPAKHEARLLVHLGPLADTLDLDPIVPRETFRIAGLTYERPHLVPDLGAIPSLPPGQQRLLAAGLRAGMAVPLKAGDRLMGLLTLGSINPNAYSPNDLEIVTAVADEIAVALDRARLQQDSAHRQEELAALYEASLTLARLLTREELFESIYRQVQAIIPHDSFVLVLARPEQQVFELAYVVEHQQVLQQVQGQEYAYEEGGLTGWVLAHRAPLLVRDLAHDTLPVPPISIGPQVACWLGVPIQLGERLLGALSVQSFRPYAFDDGDRRFLESLASLIAVGLENARLFEDVARRARELEVISALSAALRQAETSDQMLPILVEQAALLTDSHLAAVYMHHPPSDELVVQAVYPPDPAMLTVRQPARLGVVGKVFRRGETLHNPQGIHHPETVLLPGEEALQAIETALLVPVRSTERVLGVLALGRTRKEPYAPDVQRLAQAVAEIAGNAIQRARLHEQTRRDLARMTALHTIDLAISSSLDRRVTLETVASQCATQLQADAVDILLLEPTGRHLTFAAGYGFQGKEVTHTRLAPGEDAVGRVFRQKRILHFPDLRQEADWSRRFLIEQEGMVSAVVVPIVSKGEVRGVLEVFHRTSRPLDVDWFHYLELLAGTATVAIENTLLFEDLKRSHVELTQAYDATLEGWARALEYRDRETEGHTRRVTEMTVSLAHFLGLHGDTLTHIRRGALLHDIGKIGIPDAILLKPGPLTDEERAIMQRHPQIAFEMLSPIAFLRPALDIPYCHHEKWDGTGYPRGLRGEEIPLPARIFAVIDVFDALTSDRPYRPAWEVPRALEYLRAQSGTHFDPQVVEAFFAWRDSQET